MFTAFAIGGIANAFSLIDGMNGLASGTAIMILIGFALISWQQGDTAMMGVCLAAIAVMLPARNPELSPLMPLLALACPVIETLVSIHRRLVREGGHPGRPDRLHLPSLV